MWVGALLLWDGKSFLGLLDARFGSISWCYLKLHCKIFPRYESLVCAQSSATQIEMTIGMYWRSMDGTGLALKNPLIPSHLRLLFTFPSNPSQNIFLSLLTRDHYQKPTKRLQRCRRKTLSRPVPAVNPILCLTAMLWAIISQQRWCFLRSESPILCPLRPLLAPTHQSSSNPSSLTTSSTLSAWSPLCGLYLRAKPLTNGHYSPPRRQPKYDGSYGYCTSSYVIPG